MARKRKSSLCLHASSTEPFRAGSLWLWARALRDSHAAVSLSVHGLGHSSYRSLNLNNPSQCLSWAPHLRSFRQHNGWSRFMCLYPCSCKSPLILASWRRSINLHRIAALVCPRCRIYGKNTFGCISEEKLVQLRMKPGSEGPEEGHRRAGRCCHLAFGFSGFRTALWTL